MNKERIATAFLIVLTNTIGATVILPMLPLYVEKQFNATPLQATLAIATFYAAQIFAAPWLGKLSDRFGRRPILIISQIGTMVAYLMFFFAAQFGAGLERLGLSLGLSGGAVGVGHILGPALAALLSGIGLLAPIVAAAIMSAVTLLLTIVLLKETVTPEKRLIAGSAAVPFSIHHLISSRPVMLVMSTAFVIGFYIAAVMTSFALYAERVLFPNQSPEVVAQKAGIVIVLMGLGVAVSQMLLVGQLVKRLGEQAVIIFGSGLLVVSAIGFGRANSAASVALPILAYALGYSISWPSLQSMMTRFGSKETAGKLLGLFQSAFSLALILAPIAAGLILEKIGPRAVFYNGAWLMGLAAVSAVVLGHLDLPVSNAIATQPEAGSDRQNLLRRFHH